MANYIEKAAVVAEIEKKKEHVTSQTPFAKGARYGLEVAIDAVNAIEVKEVDLEKEIKEEYLKRRCYGGRDNMLVILNEPQFNKIAKHFFELGMQVSNKAQKGE